MIKSTIVAGAILVLGSPAFAEGGMVAADAVKWEPAPPVLPPGAQAAIISGDPSSDGLYVVRLKMPDGYKLAAHNHPTAEYVTVLLGTLYLGMGDKLDTSKGQPLTAGGFAEAPANMNHFAWTKGETIVQVHGKGPFDMTYINPADDPRKTR